MSTIETLLHNIEVAKHGEDVRGSIHDAIERCYNDVHSPTLNTEALEAAIQTKIDEGEMAALTIGDGTITTAKIANGAITQAKLDPNISFEADAVLDETSTNAIQNKAVASAISELNGSLETVTGKDITGTFTKKKYLVTDPTVTNQVDISSPVSNNNYSYKIISVNPGEEYTLTLCSWNPAKPWCITDSNYNIIVASSKSTLASEVVQIPDNGAYLILNHLLHKGDPLVIKGATIDAIKKTTYGMRLSPDFQNAFSDLLDTLAYESSGNVKDKVRVLKNSLGGAIYRNNASAGVSYILANVSSSNKSMEVTLGSSYTTTLTVDADYTVYDLSVKMGGIDITSSAYNDSTHVVSIASVTGDIAITALASSDYEKDTESIYSNTFVIPYASTYGNHYGQSGFIKGVYYIKDSAYNRTIASKYPFGAPMVLESGDVDSDNYLIKIPTDAVGVRVESTPATTGMIVNIHPLNENGLFDSYTQGRAHSDWGGSSASYTFNDATLAALAAYGAGLRIHTRHGSSSTSQNRYDLHPELIPKVKITFLKQE